jgi:plastocyanin
MRILRNKLLAAFAVLALAVGVWSYTTFDTAQAVTRSITLGNTGFTPADITIPVGTIVTWTNNATSSQAIMGGNGLFNSGNVATSSTFSFTFNTATTVNITAGPTSSPWTGIVRVINDTAIPAAPTGLTVTPLSSSSLRLNWNASTDTDSNQSALMYTIYKGGVVATTTPAGILTFTDTGLNPNTIYSYTILASDPAGNASTQTSSVTGATWMVGQTGPNTSTTTPTTSTSTPASTTTTTSTMLTGWLVIPRSLANQLSIATSTASSSPFTWMNGYPMINGNHIDCHGNIDNDPAHHTTNANDTDPAHHIGMNCPGGQPMLNQQSSIWWHLNIPNMPFSWPGNNPAGDWVVIPITSNILTQLLNVK